MKALFVPEGKDGYEIELMAESTEESKFLKSVWQTSKVRIITCEEWRELWELKQPKNGAR